MKTASLTSGSVGGAFLRLTAPLIVGNILQQFYNTVDALVVGRFVGENEFAAVALATGIGWTAVNVFWLVKYLRSQRETESAKM